MFLLVSAFKKKVIEDLHKTLTVLTKSSGDASVEENRQSTNGKNSGND